jgi:hypothetical protein
MIVTFTRLYARLALWSLLPNHRRALFYNLWGGKTHPTHNPGPRRRREAPPEHGGRHPSRPRASSAGRLESGPGIQDREH